MKRIGIALAIALLGAGLAQGQYGYQYVSGGYWFGVQFIGQEGWMAGAKGAIMHTTDGGRNWVFQSNIERKLWHDPPNLSFNDVFFTNPQEGWACVNGPASTQFVWHTTDGGRFWKAESLSLGTRYGYASTSKVFFANPLTGWIAGGSYGDYGNILATTDGGRTWAYQDSSHGWSGIHAVTLRHCWAVGIWGWTARTTDGGSTWLKQQVPPNKTLYDVFFSDTLYGWACGDSGTNVHTTDGGDSWEQQVSGTAVELVSVRFLDRNRGFAVGDSGTLLRTSDGGATWAPINTGVSADLATITFGDTLHGWAIGEGGTTLETSDGGLTWRVTRQGTTERIQAVSFADDQTGWMSTWEGNIWNTQDGGKIWSKQASISPKRLQGLTMANANTGWAVGDTGRILATQNGGANWTVQASGTQKTLWDVFSSDAQHAWTCGSQQVVLGTSNGGQTWKAEFYWPDPDTTIYDMTFGDSLHGWALVENGSVLMSLNRGQTWVIGGDIGTGNWYHMSFVDSLWGWVAGDSGVSRTTDGGKNWIKQSTGVAYRLWDVIGINRRQAWAVGEEGTILSTKDGGLSWTTQISPDTTIWRSVDFTDSLRGVVCGYRWIANTSDGGNTWIERLGTDDFYSVDLVDSLEGWAVGVFERILHTTDGGNTWQSVHGGTDTLRTVSFINRNEGWAGGGGAWGPAKVLHTTNRGYSWSATTNWRGPVYSVCFVDSLRGWYGTGPHGAGQMATTTDGGITWKLLNNPWGIAASGSVESSRIGAVCGNNGSLLRTVDGETWVQATRPTTKNLLGVTWGDARTAWAVGSRGIRIGTTDQGFTWQILRDDNSADSLLMSVQAFDGLTARATGYLGRSVLTTDGGTTWQGEETGTKEWLLASSFLTPTLGWVVGENGMVLKYGRLPYGVEEGEKTAGVPKVTWLGPNHPNPFTGGTEIKYQLSSRGKAKLGVYNVLGQAVRELASGEQEAGTYAIRWDGKDGAGKTTSSGVYFYRLEVFGQSQTRKMVKIR